LSNEKQKVLKTTKASNWIFCQQESRDLLIKLIIADEKPFCSVENPIFKAFIALLQPKFRLFGRTTVKKDIMAMYDKMKLKISLDLAETNQVALTTDLWTSLNQTPYMVISAH
jgi:hypothetical protein